MRPTIELYLHQYYTVPLAVTLSAPFHFLVGIVYIQFLISSRGYLNSLQHVNSARDHRRDIPFKS